MKKFLFILSLAMSLTSFQISAAALTWVSHPGNGIANDTNDEEIFGNYNNSVPIGKLNDDWIFNIDESERIELNITEFLNRDFNIGVTLDGNLLDFSQAGSIGSWDFLGRVAAGNHTINLNGLVLSKAEIDIRVAGIENVPVPAAVWLFGSGILGLLGVTSRRKIAV